MISSLKILPYSRTMVSTKPLHSGGVSDLQNRQLTLVPISPIMEIILLTPLILLIGQYLGTLQRTETLAQTLQLLTPVSLPLLKVLPLVLPTPPIIVTPPILPTPQTPPIHHAPQMLALVLTLHALTLLKLSLFTLIC